MTIILSLTSSVLEVVFPVGPEVLQVRRSDKIAFYLIIPAEPGSLTDAVPCAPSECAHVVQAKEIPYCASF